ncbi:uncharacterized protein LOC122206479 [Panthera leo]|uniref:uncharacterized protein LOC122206479 n=1 Tax=Panthera leo TaxID=9689 RepID=UPI001C69E90A|nr:uncharacterized protein LOC122206479 [Panthera leo]
MCPLSHSCGAWFHELAIAHLLWFTVFCRLPRGSRVPAERWTQEVERAPGAALGRAHRSHTVRRSKRLWPVGFGGVCHTALTSRQLTDGPLSWELQTLNVNFCEHRFLVSEKWPPAPCGPGVTAYGPRREPSLHGRLPEFPGNRSDFTHLYRSPDTSARERALAAGNISDAQRPRRATLLETRGALRGCFLLVRCRRSALRACTLPQGRGLRSPGAGRG